MVRSKAAMKSPALETPNPCVADGLQVEHPAVMAFWLQPPGTEVGEGISCNAASWSDLLYHVCAKESWRFEKRSLPTLGQPGYTLV